jgi:hypothetical protein
MTKLSFQASLLSKKLISILLLITSSSWITSASFVQAGSFDIYSSSLIANNISSRALISDTPIVGRDAFALALRISGKNKPCDDFYTSRCDIGNTLLSQGIIRTPENAKAEKITRAYAVRVLLSARDIKPSSSLSTFTDVDIILST